MKREEQKQALVNLFLSGMMGIGQVIDEAYNIADSIPNWIPVERELPKRMHEKSRFSDTVLVYNEDGYKDTAYYDYEEEIWRWMPRVTHWMPLQTQPEKGE